MKLSNARHKEQMDRMKKLAKDKLCHFCEKGFKKTHSSPVIHRTKNWFVTANDFPYEGSVHHYLIVSRKHVTKITALKNNAKLELFEVIEWVEKHLKVSGASIFVRSGDMSYTGGTLDHLHFHFLVGIKKKKDSKWLTVTLGYKK